MAITVSIQRLDHAQNLPLPAYHSEGASGLDLMAAIPEVEAIILKPQQTALVPSGFAIALPRGYEAQVRPRSGLALKHQVSVLNAPGTVDSDYRGEIKALLINLGANDFTIQRGLRMAQLVIAPVICADLNEVMRLDQTVRGAGGFGSTGHFS